MAAYSRVTPDGWEQGDDSSTFSRVTPTGWSQVVAAGGATFKAAWDRQPSNIIGSGATSMYPRNAASPERIAIGAVVLIADGTVQTSGVSVSVVPQGGAAGAGGGTIAYEQGIVHYIPTQAETNVASFLVIAYKASCIPVSVTVVTSASSTAGYAGLDWSKVTAPTTTLALTGTTIATTQKVDVETIKTQAVTAAAGVTFPGSIASPTNITAGTITTVTNLTNAATAGDFTATMKTSIGTAVAASAVASVTGSVGSVTGLTNATIADQVWDEVLSGHLTGGTTGFALNASGSSGDPWATALPGAYSAGSAGYIVGTNLDAAVSSVSAGGGLDAAGVRAAVGLASANLDTQLAAIPTATENADELLNRDMSAVSDTNARSPLNALRFIRNKWSIAGSTLTVTKENDTTAAWTAAVSTTPGADPVTGNDPA